MIEIGVRNMDSDVAVVVVGIICLTVLGVTYFIYLRQDSTVLTTLASIIGGIVGYRFGRRRRFQIE